MKVCIISGRFPETEFKSHINHKAYADFYGYSYIHCNWPTKAENNYFNKIIYLLNYINSYDYLIWIDDDAFYFDFEKDIMDFVPKGDSFLSFCKSPTFKELKTLLNSGHFIVKSNDLSKQFFKDVLTTKLEHVKEWWRKDLGFFSNGDQDAIIYLLLENDDYKGKVDLYDYKCFNSRYENICDLDEHKPLMLHFTGRGKTKHENILKTQKKLNLHPSLVSNSILKKYNIKTLEDYNIHTVNSEKNGFLSRFPTKLKQWLKG